MYAETEGIVLKQVKAINGRRMVLLFSPKYGKISAGTSLADKGKGRYSLALRPFTHGKYTLYQGGDTFHINGAETVKAYYKIGEDVEKYMYSSYVLEFVEKLLPEGAPDEEMFRLVLDFFDVLENRRKEFMTIAIAFELKAAKLAGAAPETGMCTRCGAGGNLGFFSVTEGGMLCSACNDAIVAAQGNNKLIYEADFDMIGILRYFLENSLKAVEHKVLDKKIAARLRVILKEYRAYHLGLADILSEEYLKII